MHFANYFIHRKVYHYAYKQINYNQCKLGDIWYKEVFSQFKVYKIVVGVPCCGLLSGFEINFERSRSCSDAIDPFGAWLADGLILTNCELAQNTGKEQV